MLAGDVCALTHRLELFPNNRRVDLGLVKRLRRESAVGAGHDVFTAHEIGKTDQPFGDPSRMFNDVAGVGDDPGANYLSIRQLYTLEHVVFVLVARVRRLKAELTSIDLEDILNHLGQICSVDPRPLVDAVTGVKPDTFCGYPIERGIRRFHIDFSTSPLCFSSRPGSTKISGRNGSST